MPPRPLSLNEQHHLAARERAFQVAPCGCSCMDTAKLLAQRGKCPWCNMYRAARLHMEAQEAAARAKAFRAYLEKRQAKGAQ